MRGVGKPPQRVWERKGSERGGWASCTSINPVERHSQDNPILKNCATPIQPLATSDFHSNPLWVFFWSLQNRPPSPCGATLVIAPTFISVSFLITCSSFPQVQLLSFSWLLRRFATTFNQVRFFHSIYQNGERPHTHIHATAYHEIANKASARTPSTWSMFE